MEVLLVVLTGTLKGRLPTDSESEKNRGVPMSELEFLSVAWASSSVNFTVNHTILYSSQQAKQRMDLTATMSNFLPF